ncbi:MAG: UDP-2,3-diacylglucosamine diphosphatase [Candidatus Calescibacterium sp.]|nr:UDP-2,3-diacylglucosamine diphosphatase [Candidatus Calescibacterium sp.]MCX7734054.1 UDP-2,3-diacylglucosamine diphosphatase [bacterium]MDW8087049.1 UDP-2,3-diacylglucosamine diphosphatase [Candidatus Calescibacterium sp.]
MGESKIELEGKTFVVSDIHLRRNDSRKKIFIDFMEEYKRKGNIILLGDIFDLWIGVNLDMQSNFQEFIKVIEKGKNQIIYVEGNHDFHLTWLDELGVVRTTEKEILLNGKKFLISHGDIYSGELSHRIYRKALIKTEKIFKIMVNGYFDRSINRIGEVFVSISRRKYMHPVASKKRNKIFSSMLSNAIQIAKEKKLDGVIFGHCHIPSFIKVEGKIYLNSGFWSENYGTYIEIQDSQNITIKTWER